jgi:hypothetical protein
MANLNSTSFELLGETVNVETNDSGNTLYITFGNTVIEDSSGDCVGWPNMSHLHGAALEAACQKHLREAGERAIAAHIHFVTEELRELMS